MHSCGVIKRNYTVVGWLSRLSSNCQKHWIRIHSFENCFVCVVLVNLDMTLRPDMTLHAAVLTSGKTHSRDNCTRSLHKCTYQMGSFNRWKSKCGDQVAGTAQVFLGCRRDVGAPLPDLKSSVCCCVRYLPLLSGYTKIKYTTTCCCKM